MATPTHFIDKERAFVDGLAGETGRDLGAWMEAISASGLRGRNDIIDWLRRQGFTFAKASWLERIHHNGGALIYAGGAGRGSEPRARTPLVTGSPAPVDRAPTPGSMLPAAPPVPTSGSPLPAVAAAPRPLALAPVKPVIASAAPDAAPDADLDAVLLGAKAYRPLAQALLRECLAVVPGADTRVAGAVIILELDRPFAALVPGPKGVRLHLPELAATSSGAALAPPGWQRAKSGPAAGLADLTQSILLTDARQLDASLMSAVADAGRAAGEG